MKSTAEYGKQNILNGILAFSLIKIAEYSL